MKSFYRMGKKAITKLQAAVIVIVLLIVIIAGVAYYYSTAPAPQKTPIKIGVILHMTGGPTRLCKEVWDGMNLALEEINSKGGVLGRELQFILEDDEGKSDKTLAAAKKLVEVDKVDVLAGILISGNVSRSASIWRSREYHTYRQSLRLHDFYMKKILLNSEMCLRFIQTTTK